MVKKTVSSVLDAIGNTPLVRLPMPSEVSAPVFAKLEYLNPGGSIKDRSALFMVEESERTGKLKPGGTIIEATSGNQGIALAMIGAVKGYRVIITVPDRTAQEKIMTMRAYGAEVHICPNTDSHLDQRGYHARAEALLREIPDAFMPDQYFNPLNAQAHYVLTGPELWEQTGGKITHLFVGAGTCGTISGVGRFLKEQNPKVTIIGIDSAHSFYSSAEPKAYDVEGIGIDVKSDVFNPSVVDHIIPVTDRDAFAMTRAMPGTFGLLGGISSGAVLYGLLSVASTLCADDVVVAIIADSGRAYLNKVFSYQDKQVVREQAVVI